MQKIIGNVTWQTHRPPEESIAIDNLSPENAHILDWKWVDCGLLGKHVQNVFARQNIAWPLEIELQPLSPRALFVCYGRLSVDQAGEPVYTWANDGGVTIKGLPPFGDEWIAPFKIPRRMSTGILSLAEQGIVSVIVERAPISGNFNHYMHIGLTAKGEKREILDAGRGDGSHRVVPWRPFIVDENVDPALPKI